MTPGRPFGLKRRRPPELSPAAVVACPRQVGGFASGVYSAGVLSAVAGAGWSSSMRGFSLPSIGMRANSRMTKT